MAWPEWTPYAAAAWVVGYAGLNQVLDGPWIVLGLAPVAVVIAVAAIRPRGGRLVPAGAWLMSALALAAGMFTVISVVAFVISGMLADWPGLLRQVGALVGAGLFAATAVSYQRRSRGVCGRCGEPGEAGPVSGRVRRIGYLGIAAFVPYVVLKSWWAAGFGAGPELTEGLYGLLARYGVDATAVAAVVGMVLLLALARPWGERLPRWLVLGPAWLGALLGPYGVVGLGWVLLVVLGVLPGSAEAPLWVALVGAVGFAGFGLALAVTAVSYQRRTRRSCRTHNSFLTR
ncbi:hypothetical protein [Crossiella sp. CA198]|uniref:hypothetical protein n=1 Tax=Crossiella sp. CA198 TaxID=3455607 RepID=UPI003F8D31ED